LLYAAALEGARKEGRTRRLEGIYTY